MAEYQGKKVSLDKPSRISKGEPGMVVKNLKSMWRMETKLKRLCLETQIWKSEKITQKLENHLELDINVIQQRTRLQLDTGLVKCGNYGKTS